MRLRKEKQLKHASPRNCKASHAELRPYIAHQVHTFGYMLWTDRTLQNADWATCVSRWQMHGMAAGLERLHSFSRLNLADGGRIAAAKPWHCCARMISNASHISSHKCPPKGTALPQACLIGTFHITLMMTGCSCSIICLHVGLDTGNSHLVLSGLTRQPHICIIVGKP